jgi:type I protein arginine methyltransferase
MYAISAYGRMVADTIRMEAYTEALRRTVQPGSVVLVLGTGTGTFALLAHRFDAGHVYALEPADAIQVARQIAAANWIDGIQFLQQLSTNVDLPEKADVIISDLRGVLPLLQNHIPAIIDARQRLLAPGGMLIPQEDRLWLAVVEAPDLYQRHVTPWEDNNYGFDMAPAQAILTNTWRKAHLKPDQLLLEPQCWATIDYRTVAEADVGGKLSGRVGRSGSLIPR